MPLTKASLCLVAFISCVEVLFKSFVAEVTHVIEELFRICLNFSLVIIKLNRHFSIFKIVLVDGY